MSRFIAAPGLLDRRVVSSVTRCHVNGPECFWVTFTAVGGPIASWGFAWLTGIGSALVGAREAGR